MQAVAARRHVPPEIVRYAVWLYVRFTLGSRDVEERLAERGIEAGDETVRRRGLKFGPLFARNLRRLRPRASDSRHLDEMAVSIAPAHGPAARRRQRGRGSIDRLKP